jgi:hypothetical protein
MNVGGGAEVKPLDARYVYYICVCKRASKVCNVILVNERLFIFIN